MKRKIVLGIDPGIANTALAIVASTGSGGYSLTHQQLIKTCSAEPTGARLDEIHDALTLTLDKIDVSAIAIERVYHNKNIKSSISTGKVIGLCEFTAYHYDLPVYLLTPQQVKSASGIGSKAEKADMLNMASRIFRTPIDSHHIADAAFAALAGILKHRRIGNNGSKIL